MDHRQQLRQSLLKHGNHDQKSHGNWASGGSAVDTVANEWTVHQNQRRVENPIIEDRWNDHYAPYGPGYGTKYGSAEEWEQWGSDKGIGPDAPDVGRTYTRDLPDRVKPVRLSRKRRREALRRDHLLTALDAAVTPRQRDRFIEGLSTESLNTLEDLLQLRRSTRTPSGVFRHDRSDHNLRLVQEIRREIGKLSGS